MLRIDGFIDRYFPDNVWYNAERTDVSVGCPFCGDTKKHLVVSLVKSAVHCFRCDYKASWIQFVMDVTKLSYYSAMNELYYKPRLADGESMLAKLHNETNVLEKNGTLARLPDDFELLVGNANPLAGAIRGYIEKRGFGDYHIKKYNLGMSTRYPLRVIMPIEDGYWQGRAIFDWLQPRYINPKSTARSVIFNGKALEMYDEIVVCEGAFSAMAVGSNAIALIGKEMTKEKQYRILNSTNVRKIIVALERGAFDSMQMFMDRAVAIGKEVVVWKYNTGDPADSVDFEVLQYNLRTRVTLILD